MQSTGVEKNKQAAHHSEKNAQIVLKSVVRDTI
jgi:hypothetical protein